MNKVGRPKGIIPWNKGLIWTTMRKARKGKGNPFYGKKHSEVTKKKMSESRKGKNNAFYGRHHSKETKRKISVANKGWSPSKETRRKMSLSQRGRKHTKETIDKIIASNRQREYSIETRRKISEAQLRNPHKGYRGTAKHQKLVNTVASWLNYGQNKVEIEKWIKMQSNHYRIIDVLMNDNVCFEVGRCDASKKEELTANGFEVIHLPYEFFTN